MRSILATSIIFLSAKEGGEQMAEPTVKSVEIENLLQALNPGKRSRKESIEQNICTWCGEPANKFSDELSQKEYSISGFCQKCQDKTFGR